MSNEMMNEASYEQLSESVTGKTDKPSSQRPEEATSGAFLTGVEYPHPFAELAVALCNSASRFLFILSPKLDSAAFDNEELADALSALARAGSQTEVRILVNDARVLSSRSHRLLHLARRIPSSVHIRTLTEHPDWKQQTLVIRDRDGILYKPGGSDHEGFYEPASRASTQKHLHLRAAP